MPTEIQGTIVVDDATNTQHTGIHRFNGGNKFVIVDQTDSTKSVIFNLSSLPTGTQTEFTVPDSDSSIVTLTGTQTLTNKTLTSPTLNGGTWVATDSTFSIADNTTPTKIAQFQCSGLSAGTSTFTLPDGGGTVMVNDGADFTVSVSDDVSVTAGDHVEVTATAGYIQLTATAGDIDIICGDDMTVTPTGSLTITAGDAIAMSSAADITIGGTGAGDDVILQAPFAASRIFVNGGLTLLRATTAVSASTSYQNILGVTDNSSGRTITLEADMNLAGRVVFITDEAGTAGSANNITITPESGTIDGAAGDVINSNYGVRAYYGDGTNWHSLITTKRAGQVYTVQAAGLAKAGAAAGWVVAAGDNVSLVTLPAGQAAATLVIPITGLKVGWTITGFYLIGQIESGGNTCTVDADMRKQTAAAADVTDASIGAITQISVTADTEIGTANSTKTLATPEVLAANETIYVLVTSTTAAATDVALMGIGVIVTES